MTAELFNVKSSLEEETTEQILNLLLSTDQDTSLRYRNRMYDVLKDGSNIYVVEEIMTGKRRVHKFDEDERKRLEREEYEDDLPEEIKRKMRDQEINYSNFS